MRVYQKFYEHSTHKILDVITILCIHTCNINMQNVVHTHTQISPHLKTFCTENMRTAAFHHHTSDATSRTGMFGHGIYQAAKS